MSKEEPFTILEDGVHVLTLQCQCETIFETNAYTMQNMKWDRENKVWYGVCPGCGATDQKPVKTPEEEWSEYEQREES